MSSAGEPTISNSIDKPDFTEPVTVIEKFMSRFIDDRPLPINLRQAVQYALLGGGKRLRPILAVRCCQAVGGDLEEALAPAAAIEMIHAFSLVHDDLPAMDDDDLRRGQPTLHKATSEAMAILAGDVLLGLAFELLASKVEPASRCGRITSELARATNDMIAGQVYDTLGQGEGGADDLERLATIHRHKTGALICCACRMGGIAGDGSDQQIEALGRFGEAIGLMFQIIDDLLDVTASTEQLGKTAHKDAQQGKLTYPGLLGVEKSRREVNRLHKSALVALETLGGAAGHLGQLSAYLATRMR